MLDPKNIGLGQEQYKKLKAKFGAPFILYDYKHTDGELFSCIKRTLAECRAARDEWIEKKGA